MDENPCINEVIYIDKQLSEVKERLMQENYAYVVDLHGNLRTLLLRWYFLTNKRRPIFLTYNKSRWKRWLLVHLKVDLQLKHITDRYFGAVSSLGIENEGNNQRLYIPEDMKLPNGIKPPYVVLILGANHFTKTIPINKLKEIIQNVAQPMVLLGGEKEEACGEILRNTFPERVISLCGKTSLMESAYCIQQSMFVITPDTGMMHIAAALSKKIYVVWGSTTPSLGFTPYLGKEAPHATFIENTSLPCRPCHKHGQSHCPKGHFKCMQDLHMDFVD